MGLNAIIACHDCQEQTYMMRGEEFWDLQEWMRGKHKECWERNAIRVYRDCDRHPEFGEAWDHEDRPVIRLGVKPRRKVTS